MTKRNHNGIGFPFRRNAVLCFALLAACAHTGDGEALYRAEAREELKKLSCSVTTTAVCLERIGQTVKCFCSSKETLEDLLERE